MLTSLKNALSRVALVTASFVTTSLLMLAVGAAFDHASSQPWLRDSPQARQAVARCQAHADRGARHDCLRGVVAAAAARDAGITRLATLGPARTATAEAAR